MSFKEKYLKYKNKYLNLQNGGGPFSFISSSTPTPLTKYPGKKISSTEQIIIDGINIKVDRITFGGGLAQYGPMDFEEIALNKIIILSLSNQANKKSYVPYFEICFTTLKESITITKQKIYPEYFTKLEQQILKTYDDAISKYLKTIIAEFKPIIDNNIKKIDGLIVENKSMYKQLQSDLEYIHITIQKEKDKSKQKIEEAKNYSINNLKSQIEKLNLQIDALEKSKIAEITSEQGKIDINFKKNLLANIDTLSKQIIQQETKRKDLLSYLEL
jgi:hypothetical protein